MHVKEAMHVGAESIAPDIPVREIAKKMQALDIGAMPVMENDKLIGMITDRDITCRAVADAPDLSKVMARDVMTANVIYCAENEDLGDAAHLMEEKKIRRLPVLNDKNQLVGMLSLGDLSHAASHELAGEVTTSVTGHH